jgi:hypothetical protein
MENREKRIALLKDGVVFNIIVGPSEEEMASLFNCQAIEVTVETEPAHIGLGFVAGKFEQPVLTPIPEPEVVPEPEPEVVPEPEPEVVPESE